MLYAPKTYIERTTSLISELQPIYELGNKKLDTLQIEILQYISAHPNLTAYKIWNKKAFRKPGKDKDINKRWVGRRISGLAEAGLIEMGNRPCKLTVSGLVYLILEKQITYDYVIKGILRHYYYNALFELFVYPHIKQDTLKELTSFNALSPLSQFLYECCGQLKNAVYELNEMKNQYLSEELFAWQSIPNDMNATNVLRQFLKRELNLEWTDHAKFKKVGNGDKLSISHKNNSILIKLNYTKTKASLMINGKNKYEFTVSARGKKDSVLIIGHDRHTSEWTANFVIGYIQSRVSSFVCNLILSITSGSDDFRILSQDKTFMNTLERTAKKFNCQYEVLAKMGASSS